MAQLMAPLEQATADKDTKEPFPWTHTLEMRFKEAKAAVETLHTLYLPAPSDKLVIVPDAARIKPGIGHILYAVKDNQKVPVRFHSVKLPDKCDKWQPCEIEALAFATGIEAEYDLIRESRHPVLVCPDSKTVADAVALIKKGKYSSSPRINKFITNVNKIPLEVAHVSGKAHLNEGADFQSRAPSKCNSDVCSICRFVDEHVNGVLDPAAKNAAVAVIPAVSWGNRQAWRRAQKADLECDAAYNLLKTEKHHQPKQATLRTSSEDTTERQLLQKTRCWLSKRKPQKLLAGWQERELWFHRSFCPPSSTRSITTLTTTQPRTR